MLRMYPRFSQTFVATEIAELERQGVDVHILSLKKPDDGVFHEACCQVSARARYIPESHHGRLFKVASAQWKSFRRSPRSYMDALRTVRGDVHCTWYDLCRAVDVLKWVRKYKIDHVHVHFGTSEATVAMVANILGGLSYSLTLHAFDIFRSNVNKSLLARKINRSRFTVTVSNFNKTYMRKNLPGVDADKIRVNYNGIALERFTSRECPGDAPSVFGLGRLIEKKGFVHLVRAIGQLKTEGLVVKCRIGGDGPEKSPLKEEIARLGLKHQVELIGSVSGARVQELMHQSSCFVLPCVQAKDGNIDALPTVLLESLACGCPAITTRLSGNPEIIDDQLTGLLVPPGDSAALANAIRTMVADRSTVQSMGLACRRVAEERFDIRRNVDVMRNWLLAPAEAIIGPTDHEQPLVHQVDSEPIPAKRAS